MTERRSAGARDWRAWGEARPAVVLLLIAAALVVFVFGALAILGQTAPRQAGYVAATLFASGLAAASIAVVAQSRLFPTPGPGILIGFVALAFCYSAAGLSTALANLVLGNLETVLDTFGFQGDQGRNAVRSAFGQLSGLMFFFGNLAIVVLYASVRSALAVVIWAILHVLGIRHVPGVRHLAELIARMPNDVWTNGFIARTIITVAFLTWAGLVALAFHAAIVGGGVRLDVSMILSNQASSILWAGGFILIIETAAAFRASNVVLTLAVSPRSLVPLPDNSRVEKLYKSIESKAGEDGFRDLVWAEPRQSANTPEYSTGRTAVAKAGPDAVKPQTRRVLGAARRVLIGRGADETLIGASLRRLAQPIENFYSSSVKDSAILVFDETLSSATYDVFVDMILNEVDAGGAVLILCPDGKELLVRDEIARAFADADKTFLVEVLVLGDGAPLEHQLHDVIIASETLLEHGLLDSGAQDRHREIDRLAMIMALDVHLFDLPRVRMMMRRLSERAPIADLRIVLAMTDFAEGGKVAATIFLADNARPTETIHIGTRDADTIHRLALHDTQTNRTTLREVIRGLADDAGTPMVGDSVRALDSIDDVIALLAIAAVFAGLHVVYHDPRGRRIGIDGNGGAKISPWSQTSIGWIRKVFNSNPAAADSVIGLLAKSTLPLDEPSPYGRVVIVEETFNVDAVMSRPYDFLDAAPTLMIAALRDVPDAGAHGDRTGIDYLSILPLTPEPKVGPREVAYVVGPYIAQGGLRETTLERMIGQMRPEVRQGYGFAANSSGLRRLLIAANAGEVAFEDADIDPQTGEPRFVAAELPQLTLTQELTLARDGGDEAIFMVQNDIGLTFVAHGFTRVDGIFERVETISPKKIRLAQAMDTACSFEMWRKPRLCHAYDFDFANGRSFVVEFASGVSEVNLGSKRGGSYLRLFNRGVIASGPILRRLVCWYDETEQSRPFAQDGSFTSTRRVSYAPPPPPASRRMLHLTWVLNWRLGAPPMVAPGEPDQSAEATTAHREAVQGAAVAAVVLMKDAIATCFPGQGHRIAVVSPQAAAEFAPNAEGGERYLKERYALTSTIAGVPFWEATGNDHHLIEAGNDAQSRIDLFVIEDSEWSLGIIETLLDPNSRVYVAMLRATQVRPTFGADRPPASLNIDGLVEFLCWVRR